MRRIIICVVAMAFSLIANAQYKERINGKVWTMVPRNGSVWAVNDYILIREGRYYHFVFAKSDKKLIHRLGIDCYFTNDTTTIIPRKKRAESDGRYIVCLRDTVVARYEVTALTDTTMTLKQRNGTELDYRMDVDSATLDKGWRDVQKKGMVEKVKMIYDFILPLYEDDTAWNQDRWLEMFCTPKLKTLINIVERWEEKTKEVAIGYDYWISAQDYGKMTARVVGTKAISDSTGIVRICIKDTTVVPQLRYMRLAMKKIDGEWLIDDFRCEEEGKIHSLRKQLRTFMMEQSGKSIPKSKPIEINGVSISEMGKIRVVKKKK